MPETYSWLDFLHVSSLKFVRKIKGLYPSTQAWEWAIWAAKCLCPYLGVAHHDAELKGSASALTEALEIFWPCHRLSGKGPNSGTWSSSFVASLIKEALCSGGNSISVRREKLGRSRTEQSSWVWRAILRRPAYPSPILSLEHAQQSPFSCLQHSLPSATVSAQVWWQQPSRKC